ncbi:aryl-sulfate sulfotransferase [Balneola sp. MJW-20]|uniref:aryl-sulfate sulfotransferase n=1 Tax=Gracilimonas aurantiaca TaxID=3234185 RepID=UPI00346619A0
MYKRCFIAILISFQVACGINDNGNKSAKPLTGEITDLSDLKVQLSAALTDSLVLTLYSNKIIDDRNITEFVFDSNEKILASAALIDSLDYQAENWRLNVIFSDDSMQELYAVGDRIFRAGQYEIQVDPTGFNPLSADANISMPVPGRFQIKVLGRSEFGIPITHEFQQVSFDHDFPILGLYQNFENEVLFEYKSSRGNSLLSESFFLQTETTPTPDVRVSINNLPSSDQGIFFNTDLKMGFDQRGEIRWIWTHPAHYVYRKLQNGNLIISSNENMVIYHTRRFYEVTMLGEIIRTIETPNYQHHEIREMPNGNFLVASNSTPIQLGNGQNQEDYIIEYDRETGTEINAFDFNEILDNQRPTIPGERAEDWLHMNAIFYDEANDDLIISGRAQCAVVSLDYATKELNWIISNPAGWNGDLTSKLLSPVDENGTPIDVSGTDFWPYGQHAAMTLPNGNILMYDNGRYRGYYDDSSVPADSYSRAIEYRVDPSNMTIRKIWEFNSNQSLFTPFTGDVDYLEENGHKLISFMWGSGQTPRFFELDENGEIIFEASVNAGSNHYRMEKMDLYEGLTY